MDCFFSVSLDQWFSNCGTRTTSGTRAAFLPYSKSFANSFLCYNSLVCYANVANLFICYINLKYIGVNYILLKPGVYTPTLKKHQVVRGLKKFENHWLRRIVKSYVLKFTINWLLTSCVKNIKQSSANL